MYRSLKRYFEQKQASLRNMLALTITCMSLGFVSLQSHAAIITVNSLLGSSPANGLCEFEEAVRAAATQLAVDSCTAGTASGNTITFAPSLFASGPFPKEILAGSGYAAYIISSPLTLSGPGADKLLLRVTGVSALRIGDGLGSTIPSYEVSGLSIFGSAAATGLALQGGSLYLHDVVMSGFGRPLYVIPTMTSSATSITIRRSLFTNNLSAGALPNLDISGPTSAPALRTAVLIEQTIFRNNMSTRIADFTGTDVVMRNVEISGNTTAGPLLIFGASGFSANTGKLENVTIANNSNTDAAAAGAIWARTATLDVNNTTIVNNNSAGTDASSTGGIYAVTASTVNINSSVIANNTRLSMAFSAVASDLYRDASATTINQDHSLVRDASASSGVPINGTNTFNLAAGTNPLLAPLAPNGGFSVQGVGSRNVRPLSGSPLINAGANAAALTTDGRGAGFPRVIGAAADIGAFETDGRTFFGFTQSSVSAIESSGGVGLAVSRYGDAMLAASVQCRTIPGGTATAGTDYDPTVNVLLSWVAGDASPKFCPLKIFDDALVEGDETVLVELFNALPAANASISGAGTQMTVTILDDDGPVSVPAGNIVVNSLIGPATVNGLCELEEALRATVTGFAVDGCAAGVASGNTITFAPSLFASGPFPKEIIAGPNYASLTVASPLTLIGPGADKLLLRATGLTTLRIGDGLGATNPNYEISGLSFFGDASYTGITLQGGSLNLHDVVMSGYGRPLYVTPALPSAPTLITIRRSLFTNNLSFGTAPNLDITGPTTSAALRTAVLIEQTIFRNNTSTGIARFAGTDVVMRNVEITGNITAGPTLLFGYAGFSPNTARLENVTIAKNSNSNSAAAGALWARTTTLDINNSTVVDNFSTGTDASSTGGIYAVAASTVNINSSVIAGNTHAVAFGTFVGNDLYRDSTNTTINLDHSLVRDATAFSGTPINGSVATSLAAGTNPLLAALANNGGFSVQGLTVMSALPMISSPLIGAGSNAAGLFTDMRGGTYLRSLVGSVTIGALEVITVAQPALSAVSNPVGPVTVGASVSDVATLSSGVNPTGTITFTLYGPNDASCSSTPAFIATPVTVSGNGVYPSASFVSAAAGTYRWIASYSGDATNAPVTGVCGATGQSVVVVSKANQTLTFSAPPVMTLGGTSGIVSATSAAPNSGNPVTYSTTTSAVCTVTGNVVTAISAGICIITANQAGSANYNAATPTTQSFAIAPVVPVPTLNPYMLLIMLLLLARLGGARAQRSRK